MEEIKELTDICKDARVTIINRMKFNTCKKPKGCKRSTELYNGGKDDVYLCQKAYDPVNIRV